VPPAGWRGSVVVVVGVGGGVGVVGGGGAAETRANTPTESVNARMNCERFWRSTRAGSVRPDKPRSKV
jgi:hypothetical protein